MLHMVDSENPFDLCLLLHFLHFTSLSVPVDLFSSFLLLSFRMIFICSLSSFTFTFSILSLVLSFTTIRILSCLPALLLSKALQLLLQFFWSAQHSTALLSLSFPLHSIAPYFSSVSLNHSCLLCSSAQLSSAQLLNNQVNSPFTSISV